MTDDNSACFLFCIRCSIGSCMLCLHCDMRSSAVTEGKVCVLGYGCVGNCHFLQEPEVLLGTGIRADIRAPMHLPTGVQCWMKKG